MHHFTEAESAALREAVSDLDAVWELDEMRGMRDGRGGAEYWRVSPAARLREMLGEADPYPHDARDFTPPARAAGRSG